MIATRIYLRPDGSLHKTVQLSLQFTTAMVLKYLRRKELLDESDDWALFEVDQRLGVERPLRQWESVASILTCWEDRHHVLLVKKYAYAPSLSPDVVTERPLAMHGWLTIEYKKSKWQKRYCYIKDHTVYHARDDTPNASMSVLCYLQAFDVYMVTQDYPTAPSAHVFCLRGQDRPSKYEKPEDYMRYITTDTAGSLDQWVLAIRHAKFDSISTTTQAGDVSVGCTKGRSFLRPSTTTCGQSRTFTT
ncbi:hypothetical protein DM01DRAFT_1192942 [Hesseltinella vesiculosa]|uniref:PH domain-containing protein n=1 Tax=Hesseltinella vesiculosa TaxID=101127 RepID=A0A1X2GRR0_9FUNG|nr:hypothetical protein DM01DRAFT_1192942 [Hesseltinella vesiculosa]